MRGATIGSCFAPLRSRFVGLSMSLDVIVGPNAVSLLAAETPSRLGASVDSAMSSPERLLSLTSFDWIELSPLNSKQTQSKASW